MGHISHAGHHLLMDAGVLDLCLVRLSMNFAEKGIQVLNSSRIVSPGQPMLALLVVDTSDVETPATLQI